MGDSGVFGPAMKNVPNSLYKIPKKKKSPGYQMLGDALQGAQGIPKVKAVFKSVKKLKK